MSHVTPVKCTRCLRPTQVPDAEGICPACRWRDADRIAADRRVEFNDVQLNWLTVRLQRRDGVWMTFIEFHPVKERVPRVGMLTAHDDRDAAVDRFRALVKGVLDAAWTPVHGTGARNVDPAAVFAGQV